MTSKATEPISATNSSVTKALIAVQSSLNPLRANATSHHGKFVNLQGVMEALQPHLLANNLAVIQRPIASTTGSCTLETILRHQDSGEEINSTITIPMQRQNDPQAFGAAMTYGRRYALLCLFGMVTEDDNADSSSFTLEKLLRELWATTNLDDLQNVKARHFENNLVGDKFWNLIYRIAYEKKYTAIVAASKVEE